MQEANKVVIKVGKLTFLVSSFCYKKVGMTENMKFRLDCEEDTSLNSEFDDYKSLMDTLSVHILMHIV